MKLSSTVPLLAVLAIVSASPANALTFFDVDSRQAEISRKIEDGATSGRLTALQADRHRLQLARIEAKEQGYRQDGKLSQKEQLRLIADLESLNAKVNKDTHHLSWRFWRWW